MENTIYFQSEGNVYSEKFQNKAEAMFFVENCFFNMIKGTINGEDYSSDELTKIRERSKASTEFLTELPDNFQTILGMLNWYGEMSEVEKIYQVGLKLERERELREIGELEIRGEYITKY